MGTEVTGQTAFGELTVASKSGKRTVLELMAVGRLTIGSSRLSAILSSSFELKASPLFCLERDFLVQGGAWQQKQLRVVWTSSSVKAFASFA